MIEGWNMCFQDLKNPDGKCKVTKCKHNKDGKCMCVDRWEQNYYKD